MIVVFYFLLIRPQKKRDKEVQKMRENIEIADEIVTIGGIIGRIVSIKDDTIVIETAGDRSKIRLALLVHPAEHHCYRARSTRAGC